VWGIGEGADCGREQQKLPEEQPEQRTIADQP